MFCKLSLYFGYHLNDEGLIASRLDLYYSCILFTHLLFPPIIPTINFEIFLFQGKISNFFFLKLH